MTSARIELHKGDLPAGIAFSNAVAIDTETLGLRPHRDRLCLVQLSSGDGTAHLVQIAAGQKTAPVLVALLSNPGITKIFHFARFDVAVLRHHLGADSRNIYCTKIASKLARTYTDRHGLKDLTAELLGIELSKQQQSSDWAASDLSQQQLAYAASDVLHLHLLKAKLDGMLAREGRTELAARCFGFLETRAALDLAGFEDVDIFAH
jgi:ribonuclease D